jgi:putative polyketide hydroxylase
VWLQSKDRRISTIDLFGRSFVLLAASAGSAWRSAAGRQGLPRIDVHVVGEDVIDAEQAWMNAYGVREGGAVLVRPDGYVAWRVASLPDDPARALARAFDQMLGREVTTQAA